MLLSVAVTATRVPGLKWDALEVWEASALPGAWDDVDGYLDFRTYALDRLSDLGFLDILLDDLLPSPSLSFLWNAWNFIDSNRIFRQNV